MVATCLLVAGCGDTALSLGPPVPGTVRIVTSLPSRGPDAAQAHLMREAVDLAIRRYGQPLPGLKVEHVALDASAGESGEWSRATEARSAAAAVADASVLAYIGPYTSGATAVSLPVTNKAGLLQLAPSATWPGLSHAGYDPGEPQKYSPAGVNNFVRLMPDDEQQGAAAVDWCNAVGCRSVFVLDDGSTYSTGLARSFTAAARGRNINISGFASLSAQSLNGIAGAAHSSGADALFYAPSSASQAVAAARALSSLILRAGLFSTDTALDASFLDSAAGSAASWHIVHNGVSDPSQLPAARSFVSEFTSVYTERPSQFAYNSYLATWLALEALQHAGKPDRSRVLVQANTLVRAGGGGTILFDPSGEVAEWTMTGYRIGSGSFLLDRLLSHAP
ncbi:MAG: branched-chain amino acid ABC transporter substrate-binding protein [Chloroflexota bacterium]|nr:branched-chain amino acid ABC transporter substrate-binding protein [Chloroflexota bacterium]